MAKPTTGDWDELTRDLSTRVAAFAPEWTEPSSGDPGLTLVELFGFLTESLLSLGDTSPEVRSRLDEIVARLQRVDGGRMRGRHGDADALLLRQAAVGG